VVEEVGNEVIELAPAAPRPGGVRVWKAGVHDFTLAASAIVAVLIIVATINLNVMPFVAICMNQELSRDVIIVRRRRTNARSLCAECCAVSAEGGAKAVFFGCLRMACYPRGRRTFPPLCRVRQTLKSAL
jgi:hypothetical protein